MKVQKVFDTDLYLRNFAFGTFNLMRSKINFLKDKTK